VAKVRDGRPIKLEGNTLSSGLTKGKQLRTTCKLQLFSIYHDTARLRTPMITSGDKKTSVSLEAADQEIAAL
jgi:hypothetical protein